MGNTMPMHCRSSARKASLYGRRLDRYMLALSTSKKLLEGHQKSWMLIARNHFQTQFWTGILTLGAVEMWTLHPEDFASACGFDVNDPKQYKLVKDFCNSAAGSGTLFANEWLAKANLTQLPDVMILYREQLRVAAKRDTEARPEIAKTLTQQGWKETDVQNKTHYICNSEIERKESDAALGRRQKITETVAFESDGHPCLVDKAEDIEKILKVMNKDVDARK